MDKEVRRWIQNKYKERKILGGVYVITSMLKNKMYVDCESLWNQENHTWLCKKIG